MERKYKSIINFSTIGILLSMVFLCSCFGGGSNKNSYEQLKASFVGTYTAEDAVGTKLTFILSEDGSVKCIEECKSIFAVANSYSKNNEFGDYRQTDTKTHYGHWSHLSNAVPCEITIKNGPDIYFNANDGEHGYTYQIKNGYLYTDIDDCKSAHPERRLRLTKQ
jgi:hypothetical protein